VKFQLPTLFSNVRDSKISVAAALVNRRWVRDISGGLSAQAIAKFLHLWDIVEGTNLTEGKVDEAVYRRTANGVFTVKSAYNMFFLANVKFACANCQADLEVQGAHEM
jgi:hypothetical protein